MDIRIISSDCVRVGLNADDCAAYGISYGSFSPSSIPARLFIASALTRLESLGMISERPQKLTAEVFEDDGGLAVYISGRGLSCRMPENDAVGSDGVSCLLLKTPREVITAAASLSPSSPAELYALNGGYALISAGELAGGQGSEILSAAIKEHGRLLSDAPHKILYGL